MNDYIRELLRMAGGDPLGGRNKMIIPDELMDVLAGDAAQEEMMKDQVLQEMRKHLERDPYHSDYVNLDMMTESMERGDVDGFLKEARKKIIKRSKATRKGCCKRIGGVLQQMMGPIGGDYAKKQPAKDRGQDDPIGEDELSENLHPDHIAVYKFRKEAPEARDARISHYKKTGEVMEDDSAALFSFIAEEFRLSEHDGDCKFAADLWNNLNEQEKFIQKAIKRPGALRSYFGVVEGGKVPVSEARAKLSELRSKAEGDKKLSESESRLLKQLNLFLKVLKPATEDSELQETDPYDTTENHMSGNTAQALADFMESHSHTGAVGNLSPKGYDDDGSEAAYNKGYDTIPAKLASGRSKKAGAPSKPARAKPRYAKGADPIGEEAPEDDGPVVSETASALSDFMEAYKHTSPEGDMSPTPYWGPKKTRSDTRDYLGGALKKAGSAARSGKARYKKGSDPIGDATKKQLK